MTAAFTRVDHVVIAVRDLAAAEAAYAAVLGRAPSSRGRHPDLGTRNVIFGLENCYLELLAVDGEPSHPVAVAVTERVKKKPEGLLALALGTEDLAATAAALRSAGVATTDPVELRVDEPHGTRHARLLSIGADTTRGVNVFGIAHDRSGIALASPLDDERAAASAVDHVVLFSDDADATLGVWRDAFGIPERWRREFPDRGTLNVGLRLAGVTIEIVAPLGATGDGGRDRLWGLAYAVPDCDRAVARIRAANVAVSDVRAGLAPATRVATVKRPDGVATLLIEHTR